MQSNVMTGKRYFVSWALCMLALLSVLVGCGGTAGGGNTFHASTGSMDDGLTSGNIFGRATDGGNGAGMGNVLLSVVRTGGTAANKVAVDRAGEAAKTADSSGSASDVITIDADGHYESPSLLAGKYTITASRQGFDSYTADVDVPGGVRVERNFSLTVSNGTTGIRGVLRDASQKPVTGATLTVTGSGTKATGIWKQASAQATVTATTNVDGWYSIGLGEGVYSVTIEHPSFSRRRMPLTVKAGQMQQLDLVMRPGNPQQADISGFIRDSQGRPISGANVSLDYTITRGKSKAPVRARAGTFDATISGFVQTDDTGFYAFPEVAPGSYVVKAEHPRFLANSAKVTAAAGQSVQQDITLHWRLVSNGNTDWYLGVWANSSSNVYVVGALGVIKHYDGNKDGIWTYQTSPTGENLFSVWGTQDGSLVLAVGNGNTVMRTTDGGTTWTPIGAGVGASVHSVSGTPDGKIIYAISPFGSVFKSLDRGLTWIAGQYASGLPAPRSSTGLNQVSCMPDGGTVFITGYDTVYRSTDSGNSWETIQTGVGDQLKYLHCWIDGNGGRHVVAGGDLTNVTVRSDDDGKTWTRHDLPALNAARRFEQRGVSGLADGSAIYAVTTQYAARSTDGGTTWTQVADTDIYDFAICATTDVVRGECLFMASANGRTWRATKAAAIWDSFENDRSVWSLYSVFAFTATEICAVGEFNPSSARLGAYIAGLFGDKNFQAAIVHVAAPALRAIWGTPELLYCAAANKGICSSSDHGANWRQVFIFEGDKYYLSGLSGGATWARFAAVGHDLSDGEKGLFLFQGADEHWYPIKLNAKSHLRAVTKLGNQDRFVAVGQKGQVLIFEAPADVATYVPKSANVNGVTEDLHSVWCDATGANLFASGDNGTLIASTDGGLNWTKTTLGTGPLYGVWGTSASDVFVVGRENYRYDGKTWLKMTAQNEGTVDTDKFYSIGVSGSPDAKNIYAVGLGGRVYVTER